MSVAANVKENEEECEDNNKQRCNGIATVAKSEKQRWCNVAMLPCKLTYMIWGGMVGTNSPYLNVFFVSIGLTPSQAGVMTGVRLISSSIANPLWGFVADYTGRRRLVMLIMCVGAASLVTPMPWIARALHQALPESTNGTTSSYGELPPGHQTDNSKLFYSLLSILVVGNVFAGPLFGYIDTIAMNVVKSSPTKATYGGQRIFGSIGFCMANFMAGLAADYYRVPGMSHYTPIFIIFFIYTTSIIPFGAYLIGQGNFEKIAQSSTTTAQQATGENVTQGGSLRKHLWSMVRQVEFAFFMGTVLISGFAMSLSIYFSLLLVKDEMPRSKAQMSLVQVVASFSNLVLFPFTSKIIKLIGGPCHGLILSQCAYFVRFLVMSYTTSFALMIAIQSIHGICFALAWASFMEYLHKITPKEITITMFMLLSSIHFGVMGVIGNIVGGKVYQHYDGRRLFMGAGIISGLWALVLVLYHGTRYMKNSTPDTYPVTKVSAGQENTQGSVATTNNGTGHSNGTLDVEMNSLTNKGPGYANGIQKDNERQKHTEAEDDSVGTNVKRTERNGNEIGFHNVALEGDESTNGT